MIKSRRHIDDKVFVQNSINTAVLCDIIEIIWENNIFTYKVRAMCKDGVHYAIAFVSEDCILDLPIPDEML